MLEALRDGTREVHPFRGARGDAAPESYQAPVDTRKWPFAMVLAPLVPIGAGHFYARHGASATILAAGILGCVLGVQMGMPSLFAAAPILVALDFLLSPLAVRRFNAGRVPAEMTQRAWALGAVVAAIAAALLLPRPG